MFLSHVKVLTLVRLGSNKLQLRLKIPSNETLMHAVMRHVCQEFCPPANMP